jgi:L-alanine-DL-glutamate epimerase-like enolase superfamily enzyme
MKELPWPIYKIKLGTPEDIAIVTALRKHTDAVFRIDANCGWTVDETINAIELKKLGVEFLEQPLKADDWAGHKKFTSILFYQSSLMKAVSLKRMSQSVNIISWSEYKISQMWRLNPGRRMIQEAKQLGMKTMVGCMTESTVGISAITHYRNWIT